MINSIAYSDRSQCAAIILYYQIFCPVCIIPESKHYIYLKQPLHACEVFYYAVTRYVDLGTELIGKGGKYKLGLEMIQKRIYQTEKYCENNCSLLSKCSARFCSKIHFQNSVSRKWLLLSAFVKSIIACFLYARFVSDCISGHVFKYNHNLYYFHTSFKVTLI